jgi:glycyl-tRNA synthetase (class II)
MRLKTWDEARALFAKHLKPVSHTPKGWPVYAQEEIDALLETLNVRLPEDFDYLKQETAQGRRIDFDNYLKAVPSAPPLPGDELDA